MYEDTVLEYNNYLCTFVLLLFVVVSCLFWHLVDGGIVGGTVGHSFAVFLFFFFKNQLCCVWQQTMFQLLREAIKRVSANF